jgi:hypothetical protein
MINRSFRCYQVVERGMWKKLSIILFLLLSGVNAALAQNELKRDQYLFAFQELFDGKKYEEATQYVERLSDGSYNIDAEYYYQFGLNYYELCDLEKADAFFDTYYQKAGKSGANYKQLLKLKNNIENEVYTDKCKREIKAEFHSKPRSIKIINSCEYEIKFAIRYEDITGKWRSVGWYKFAPGHGHDAVLSANNERLIATEPNIWISFDRSQFSRYVQLSNYYDGPSVYKVGDTKPKHYDFYIGTFRIDGDQLVHEITCSEDQQRVNHAKEYGYGLYLINKCNRDTVFFVAAFKRFSNKKFTIFRNSVDGDITREVLVRKGGEELYTHWYNKYSEKEEPYKLDGDYFYMHATFGRSGGVVNKSDKRMTFIDPSGDKDNYGFEKRFANPVFYDHKLVSRVIMDCP